MTARTPATLPAQAQALQRTYLHFALCMLADDQLAQLAGFWANRYCALRELRDGVGLQYLRKEAAMGLHYRGALPTQVELDALQATLTRLAIGIKAPTLAEVQQLYAAAIEQGAAQGIADGHLNRVEQLEHGVCAAIHLYGKEAAPGVDGDDGAGQIGAHAAIVAQGAPA